MKCSADRLPAELKKNLAPLYVLAGDQPLLVDEALQLIRERARAAGCGERELQVAERGFDWDAFATDLRSLSLFASRRLIELRLPSGKPGEAGGRCLTALARDADHSHVVVVMLPALDGQTARSAWATALAESAVWVELKAPGRAALPDWLRRRLTAAGLEADDEALDLLAARVEGNLLAAKQELDKLALLAPAGRVTAATVRGDVADGARFDVFQLCEAALQRDAPRAVRILGALQREGEGDVLVLWALVRDILTLVELAARVGAGHGIDEAMRDMNLWRSRQEQFRTGLKGRRPRDVAALLGAAAGADRVLKGARPGNRWGALTELTLLLAGAVTPQAETA
jgi:DNA polymerase-3 subunit delta